MIPPVGLKVKVADDRRISWNTEGVNISSLAGEQAVVVDTLYCCGRVGLSHVVMWTSGTDASARSALLDHFPITCALFQSAPVGGQHVTNRDVRYGEWEADCAVLDVGAVGFELRRCNNVCSRSLSSRSFGCRCCVDRFSAVADDVPCSRMSNTIVVFCLHSSMTLCVHFHRRYR